MDIVDIFDMITDNVLEANNFDPKPNKFLNDVIENLILGFQPETIGNKHKDVQVEDKVCATIDQTPHFAYAQTTPIIQPHIVAIKLTLARVLNSILDINRAL